MPSKLVNVVLLILMVILDAAILATVTEAGMRLALGLLLLVPIVLVSAHLELADAFGTMMPKQVRPRRFPALRANVNAFLTEVKRLNWLVVDLDRGFGREEATSAEIESCQKRMEELLVKIRESAGQAVLEGEELAAPEEAEPSGEAEPPGEDTPPSSTGADSVG